MRVLVIGQTDRTEMQPLLEWMRERTPPEAMRSLPKLSVPALEGLDQWRPDLMVVLESKPDEYTADDVSRLFAFAPTSRIVCCAGAWSESAGRTRRHWPLALRVPAVSAITRLEQEWKLLNGHSSGPLAPASGERARVRGPINAEPTTFPAYLPPTGSREEWFSAHHPALMRSVSRAQQVRIVSPDTAYRAMLADSLTQSGFTVTSDEATADVILWDGDPWSPVRSAELQQLANSSRLIAVSGWVTPELIAQLQAAGAETVLPKLGDTVRLIEVLAGDARIPD